MATKKVAKKATKKVVKRKIYGPVGKGKITKAQARKAVKTVLARDQVVKNVVNCHLPPGLSAEQVISTMQRTGYRFAEGGQFKVGESLRENEVPFAATPGDSNAKAAQHKDILQTAKEIIYGDREEAYGTPGFNLKSIGDLWSVYLRRRNPSQVLEDVTMEDVCQMMILLKTARLINKPGHIDSLVDQAGYAALQERVL